MGSWFKKTEPREGEYRSTGESIFKNKHYGITGGGGNEKIKHGTGRARRHKAKSLRRSFRRDSN